MSKSYFHLREALEIGTDKIANEYKKATPGQVAEAPEDDMPASPDEAGMAMDQAKFIGYVADEIMEYIQGNNEFPEWMQNKLSALHEKAKGMHAVMAGKYNESVDESLRKDIAAMSAKYPEGSKVRMKHDGKVAKVVSVGKDFVKVAVGNKTMDHKPSELEKLNEAKKVTNAQIHKVLGPTKNAQQGIEALKKAFKVNDKEAEAMLDRVMNEANRGSDSYRVKYKGDINTVRADSPEDALKKTMKAFGISSFNKSDYMKNASAIAEKYTKPTQAEIDKDRKKDQSGKSKPSMDSKSLKKRLYNTEDLDEKLEVSDGLDAWIKDFQASDAPQFEGKDKEERRNMAIAAYLAAKRDAKKGGDTSESTKAYGKTMSKQRNDKKKAGITDKDKQTLGKLADLMKREKR